MSEAELSELKRIIRQRCMSNDPVSTILVVEIKDGQDREKTWGEIYEELKRPTYIPGQDIHIQIDYTPVFSGGKYFYTSGWHEYVKKYAMKKHMKKFKNRVSYLLATPYDEIL
jgi:hypothetical protein